MALGFALVFGSSNHAAAVYPHIAARVNGDRQCRAGDLLASVIVHELAHLMLRSTSHGEGIMAAGWNSRDLRSMARRTLLFTPAQAAELAASLRPAR